MQDIVIGSLPFFFNVLLQSFIGDTPFYADSLVGTYGEFTNLMKTWLCEDIVENFQQQITGSL